MSPQLRVALPALVVAVLGVTGMAFLKYWEVQRRATVGQAQSSQSSEQPPVRPDAPSDADRGRSEAGDGVVPTREVEGRGPSPRDQDGGDSPSGAVVPTPSPGAPTNSLAAGREPAAGPRPTGTTPGASASRGGSGAGAGSPRSGAQGQDARGKPVAGKTQGSNSSGSAAGFAAGARGSGGSAPGEAATSTGEPSGSTSSGGAPTASNPPASPPFSDRSDDRDDVSEPEDPEPPTIALVRMSPPELTAFVGDTVSISIEIAQAQDVGHVPFHVTYNPEVLEFNAGDEGSFLSSDGNQTAFFAATSTGSPAVVIGLSRMGRVPGIEGAGHLCTLHFSAIGPGNAGLGFDRAKVRDSGNRIVPGQFFPANVTVE